ncbi:MULTISPECIES: hypothetical protein [Acinetobacter]|uniref:hypothetical protein n=1 Tax=Acinetobacter TaxID=469 RepID=UPI000D00A4C4|nr:hypothetical protein [Acinetobacter sp. MYb10]QLD61367.1 hypothetical protein CQZ96_008830 [Acinetobacter sp. MYb10]
MTAQIDILDEFLKRLITSPAQDAALVNLVNLFERVIADKNCLPNIDIPYDDITSFIYDFSDEINLIDLDLMLEELENRFLIRYPLNIRTGKKHSKHLCISKFRTHIFLAATQKIYVAKVAQELAINADKVAKQAGKTAKEAKDQAEKAKKTYDDMMVNYITILGIFASIIITIFGGMQIISATTGLLQANINLATLILVLSFLSALIILILSTLFNFISNLKESQRSNKFIYIALGFSIVAMISSAAYMYKIKQNDVPKINSKVLIKDKDK